LNQYKEFKALHEEGSFLILPNAWNVNSALLYESLNFNAVATSSGAISEMLGYDDAQQIPLDIYLYLISQIKSAITIPLSVDLEWGYGRSIDQIIENIEKLISIGVSGINIEDSEVVLGKRNLKNAAEYGEFLGKLIEVKNTRKLEIFINVRTDTYLLDIENRLEDTIKRIALYESVGVDGIFIPGVYKPQEISQITSCTKLPVNVMSWPNLPDFGELKSMGVRRISFGNFVFKNVYNELTTKINDVMVNQNSESLFEKV